MPRGTRTMEQRHSWEKIETPDHSYRRVCGKCGLVETLGTPGPKGGLKMIYTTRDGVMLTESVQTKDGMISAPVKKTPLCSGLGNINPTAHRGEAQE